MSHAFFRRAARRDPHGMSGHDFAAAVMARSPASRQTVVRFSPSLGGPRGGGSVYVNFINLPPGIGSAGGGAEAENNRAMFYVRGFPYEAHAPAERVKVEMATSALYRGSVSRENRVPFRAKTGTPAAIAKYLTDFLNRVAAEIPPRFTHTHVMTDPRRRHDPRGVRKPTGRASWLRRFNALVDEPSRHQWEATVLWRDGYSPEGAARVIEMRGLRRAHGLRREYDPRAHRKRGRR